MVEFKYFRTMIRFLTLTISLCLVSIFSQAQEVKWYTFEEAVALNSKEPRNIMIDVYTDWCGWCKVMDQKTFSLEHIAKLLNEDYYPVKFDAETMDTITFQGKAFVNTKQGNRPPHELAVALLNGKLSYPNIVFLNKENKVLGALPGFKKPDEMEAILDYITKELYTQKIDMGKYIEEFKKE